MSQQQDSNQNELTRNNSLSVQAATLADHKMPNDKSIDVETGRKPSKENVEKPVIEGERSSKEKSGIDGRPMEQI